MQLQGRFDLVLESVGGDTLAGLLTKLDPDGTLVMFGNSSGQTTAFNVRDIYLDACVRLQGFELFHRSPPFARDLHYLARLVAAGALDPQLAGTLPWTDMPAALERLRNMSRCFRVAARYRAAGTLLLLGRPGGPHSRPDREPDHRDARAPAQKC